jgi:hypothetical protein
LTCNNPRCPAGIDITRLSIVKPHSPPSIEKETFISAKRLGLVTLKVIVLEEPNSTSPKLTEVGLTVAPAGIGKNIPKTIEARKTDIILTDRSNTLIL